MFTMAIDGGYSISSAPLGGEMTAEFVVNGPVFRTTENVTQCYLFGAQCDYMHTLSSTLILAPGASVVLAGSLNVLVGTGCGNFGGTIGILCNNSETADFSNTAQVYVTLPVGWALVSDSGYTYSLPTSAVPEPSTWLLMGTGLAGLVSWRRMKRL
jgi:hypothetical protein